MSNKDTANAFEVVEVTPWNELEGMLREIPLYGQPDTRPYADADISIERFRLSELVPTTRYVVRQLVEVQANLRTALLPQGYDQLDLRAGRLILASQNSTVRIMPPIVERFKPEGLAKYILDGSHRAQLTWQLAAETGIEEPELTVIYVRNGITYPPYALPNAWEEVQVVPERPADKSVWKNYRNFPNRYDLYRDYDGIIDSKPRGLDE